MDVSHTPILPWTGTIRSSRAEGRRAQPVYVNVCNDEYHFNMLTNLIKTWENMQIILRRLENRTPIPNDSVRMCTKGRTMYTFVLQLVGKACVSTTSVAV